LYPRYESSFDMFFANISSSSTSRILKLAMVLALIICFNNKLSQNFAFWVAK
jgi:hypothetical protein